MGLGAPRKRSKLSNDPNNTAWSRSATKYGQKILQSHGWMPGDLLGASGASYSDLHSAASASHIRITLKENNLGLGAKHEAARDSSEITGLDVFQDLLGRLNGRTTTDLTKHPLRRSSLRSSAYIDQRWGNLDFVSGGLLVGAESRDPAKGERDAPSDCQQKPSHYPENGALPEANRPQEVRSKISKREKHQKRKRSVDDRTGKETSRRVDWRVAWAQSPKNPLVETAQKSHTSLEDISDHVQMDQARRHAEKAERKLKRRIRRDARSLLKVREQSSITSSPDLIQVTGPDTGEVTVASHPLLETVISNRLPQGLGAGRLAVRHRYIQHKKMCTMDKKALNEILMIKS